MSKRSHAIHNEEACDYLLESGKFNDWVVTTAFYSALHFVQHEIFPATLNGRRYDTFNEYFKNLPKSKRKKTNKHKETINLVKTKLPSCHSTYKWMYNSCMTARYSNYNISSNQAKTARSRLKDMKEMLTKK